MGVTFIDLKLFFLEIVRFLKQPFWIAGFRFSLLQVWLYTSVFHMFFNQISRIFGKSEVVDGGK